MKHFLWLILRLLAGLITLLGSRATRALLAENLLLKQQLLVLRRSRRRAPNLHPLLFWNAEDLERKLDLFRRYYNGLRVHQGLEGDTPEEKAGSSGREPIHLESYTWQSRCHGLF